MQVRRVALRRPAEQKHEPVPQAIRVRHRAEKEPTRPEDAARLGDRPLGEGQVLEQLAAHDDVEAPVLERQRLGDVGVARLDPELRRLGERLVVDVHPDDLVPLDVGPGQRPVAAAEVEHPAPGAAHPLPKCLGANLPAEDEIRRPSRLVVVPVGLVQLLQAGHGPSLRGGTLDSPVATHEEPAGAPLSGDIRRSRPYFLAASPLRSFAFRVASFVCLLAIDLASIGIALYGALVLRELYYGHTPILWGVLWTGPFERVVPVRRPRDGARVLAGGAVRRA